MKSIIRTLVIIGLIAFSLQTHAQVKFGIKAGLNANNINQNFKESDWEEKTNMRFGYHIGAAVDLGLSEVISLQSGLLFSSKGFSWDVKEEWGDDTKGYDRAIFNYVEIPVNIVYKINDFQIFAGPYVALGIGGKNKWDVKWDGGSDADYYKFKPVFGEAKEGDIGDEEEPYNALDAGFNLGVGYQVGPVLLNLGYSLGLVNMTVDYEGGSSDRDDFKVTNRVITLSASYFFGE